MHIAFHLGAHCTDVPQLRSSLRRNVETLTARGIAVPETDLYHPRLHRAATERQGRPASPEEEAHAIDDILDGQGSVSRMILSNRSFICSAGNVIEGGDLYGRIDRAGALRTLFPSHSVSFHLAMRDPATFLPALFRMQDTAKTMSDFLGDTDLRGIRWSDVVQRLLDAAPDAAVTLWCYEDAPLIWDEILRDVAGLGDDVNLHGAYDMARQIMVHDGMVKLRSHADAHPPTSPRERHRLIADFVERFAEPSRIEAETDLPEWSTDLMAELTYLYEEDLARLPATPRLKVISP